jgi:hypothetical protein
MSVGLYPVGTVPTVRALLLGERIDLKGFDSAQRLATNPLVVSAGQLELISRTVGTPRPASRELAGLGCGGSYCPSFSASATR